MIELTAFQADEVNGLLAVCEDEADGPDAADLPVWGHLEGRALRLIPEHTAFAAEDLRHRADRLRSLADDEGRPPGRGPSSLEDLAATVQNWKTNVHTYDRPLTADERATVDTVKAAYRAATTPAQRIAASNSAGPANIALAVLALHELEEES